MPRRPNPLRAITRRIPAPYFEAGALLLLAVVAAFFD
jgi:hypothetical protein